MSAATKMTTVDPEDQEIDDRVQRMNDAPAAERAHMVRRFVVQLRELVAMAPWAEGIMSDIHDDCYPDCQSRACSGGRPLCAACRQADGLASKDPVVQWTAALGSFWANLPEHAFDELPGPDDPVWAEMERRLRSAERGESPWVAFARRQRANGDRP